MNTTYLLHYGIKGQRWGERRFQYENGTLTPEGERRYLKDNGGLTVRGRLQKHVEEYSRDANVAGDLAAQYTRRNVHGQASASASVLAGGIAASVGMVAAAKSVKVFGVRAKGAKKYIRNAIVVAGIGTTVVSTIGTAKAVNAINKGQMADRESGADWAYRKTGGA